MTTNWFSANLKPVREGMYERRSRTGVEWSWFDINKGIWGAGMLCSCSTCMEHSNTYPSQYQNSWKWRGLIK